MVKEKPRQYKAELESFKSFTHRVRDLVQFMNVELASKDEISRKIFDGEFEQAVHIMAFYMDAAKEV